MRKSILQGISSRRRSLLLGMLMLPAVLVQAQTRQVENLNWGWRFQAGDVPGAGRPLFDDTRWREVDLPHDFQIEQPWVAPASD